LIPSTGKREKVQRTGRRNFQERSSSFTWEKDRIQGEKARKPQAQGSKGELLKRNPPRGSLSYYKTQREKISGRGISLFMVGEINS